MPQIRGVFFDLDDTLCDTIGTREARARLAFEILAPEQPELDRDAFLARVMDATGSRIVRGVPAVVKELGLAESEAGRRAVSTWFFDGCIDLLRMFDGVADTVNRLRTHYRLGVITNGDGKVQRVTWLKLQLGIDLIVISSEVGYEKPDPRIFTQACSLAEIQPGDAVFVGDRLDIDVAGAKSAGMRAVWFNNWSGSVEDTIAEPDAVIQRFGELPMTLAEL